MKKLFIILLLFIVGFVFAEKKTYKMNPSGNFTLACPRCKELTQGSMKGYCVCLGCAMWRRYSLELGEHEYFIYKCKHGHTIYLHYDGTAELR